MKKYKVEMYKGLSVEHCWLPLINSIVEGSNMAMIMSHNDDIEYVKIMCGVHDVLVPMYVDTGVMSIEVFNRLFYVWVYLLEFKYGEPNSKEEKIIKRQYSPRKVFEDIKKNWNVDINKELQKVKKFNMNK